MEKQELFFIETFGCQMNFSDTEIVSSILIKENFQRTTDISQADIIFLNTCSIRDNAEQRVYKRLEELKSFKKKKKSLIIGVLGCMAERLKEYIFEKIPVVDIIAGPDSYRDIITLVRKATDGEKAFNTELSLEETYADINPVRVNSNGISAFVSVMRGCENFCSYCVVPYTRGKERSRNPSSIINEIKDLFFNGYKEVTLLGQNVNSYNWDDNNNYNFAKLINEVASIDNKLRVRFATSHPKDLSDELLHIIGDKENVCKSIHLPVQSGSNKILHLMNRKYTRDWYIDRIEAIRRIIPQCSISTDIITGFPSESLEDFNETISLMEIARFDFAYMFKYSEREGTLAAKKYKDDINEAEKVSRLQKIINLQQELSLKSNQNDVGKTFEVLAEKVSKRSKNFLAGRNSQNKVVIFESNGIVPSTYVDVKINSCTAATLMGEIIK